MKKNVTLGIDLGTTNSLGCIIENQQPIIIINEEGKRTTPSVISMGKETKIGDAAKRMAVTNPTNTVSSIKRFMGRKYSETRNIKTTFKTKEGKNDRVLVELNGRDYTPQELSAMILQKIKKSAEDYLGYEIKDAVITVPAYFSDSQRQATKEAAEISGLNCLRIINEPTAAALAYGLDKKEKAAKIAVYDLGGGTFDISILDIGDGLFEVKSTNGNVNLGGDNFDEKLIDYLVAEFKSNNGIDLSKDLMAYQRLKEAAEKVKIELSSSNETDVNLPYITVRDNQPLHFVTKITKAKFEQLIDELVNSTIEPCRKAVQDAGLKISDIDEVILVGGSTRIPKVQEVVEKFFGKKPSKNVNPDEVVGVGAAIQGSIINGDINDIVLLDVTPVSLGIETMGGVFTKLIEANTTIPTNRKEIFSTAMDNQPSVDINVLQGERPMAKDNKTLGKFTLDNIPPAQRGTPKIEVSFDIDTNGILSVSAKDTGTGKEQKIRIENSSLSKEEIERMKSEAQTNLEEDQKQRDKIDVLNNVDTQIFGIEKSLSNDKITDEDRTEVNEIIVKLKDVVKIQDMDKISEISKNLTEKWNNVTAKLYSENITAENIMDNTTQTQ